MRRVTLLPMALAWMAASVALAAEGAERFRWKWTPGAEFRMEFQQQQQQQLASGEIESNVASNLVVTARLVVAEVSDEHVATLTQKIERVQLSVANGTLGTVQYDSQVTEEPRGLARQIAQRYRGLVGREIRQRIDARGAVLEQQIPEGQRVAIAAGPPLGQWLTQEGLVQMTRRTLPVLPEQPIEPGFQWEAPISLETPVGTAQLKLVYKYVGSAPPSGAQQLDEFDVQVSLALQNPPADRPLELAIVEQTGQGKMWFDRAAGYLTGSRIEQKLTVEIRQQDNLVRQTLTSTTDVKLFPVSAQEEGETPAPQPPAPSTAVAVPQ